MRVRHWFLTPALAVLLLGGGQALVGAEKTKGLASFGTLEPANPAAVKAEAEAWFNKTVKDTAKKQKFEAVWKAENRPLFDRVIDTLSLDKATAKVLADANDPLVPAPCGPKAVPLGVKNKKMPAFYRANLALAYAKALSNRRIYEEALDTLKAVNAEDVADPAAYLFHRSVAEFAMLKKKEATRSISRLLDDVADAPERYKTVGALMLLDMLTWKEKDLNWIARKMDNSGRRLQLARGGPVTQKIQKDIVRRLDEIIKELENKKKGS
jgi:hypothetical protein